MEANLPRKASYRGAKKMLVSRYAKGKYDSRLGVPQLGNTAYGRTKGKGTRMKRIWMVLVVAIVLCGLLVGCQPASSETDQTPASSSSDGAGLPNPASAYCLEQGYKHEIRTAADGSQSGVCIFPDGSGCDEWSFYRSECGPDSSE